VFGQAAAARRRVDNKGVDRMRAETYLRQVAEAELRRAMDQPAQTSPIERHPGAGRLGMHSMRLDRVAQALISVGALEMSVAEAVDDAFGIALAVRPPGQSPPAIERAAMARRQVSAMRRVRASSVSVPPAPPGTPLGPPGGPALHRIASAGVMLPVSADDERGELYLLAYSHTGTGARLTAIGRSRGHAFHPGIFRLDRLAATDDKGNSYGFDFTGESGGSEWSGELTLRPEPPPDIRWLDVESGDIIRRIDLDPQSAPADVTLTRDTHTPGEHYLHGIAAQILASFSTSPHDLSRQVIEFRPRPPGHVTHGIGDIVAALLAAGVLSALSPVPGQLVSLCESLSIADHGIAASPARDLPEPWLSMLAHIHRRKPRAALAAEGGAGAALALPELDGIRLCVLGLHNGTDGTVLHVQATGVHSGDRDAALPLMWIRDESGRWHTTRKNMSGMQHDGEMSMRLDVVPPLGRGSTIELLVAGWSAQVRATLPLRWS
jgi:hypothetical protein